MIAKPANATPAPADASEWPACDPAYNAHCQTWVDVPFPIISPFLMRSDLQKLDTAQDGLTRLDCQYPLYARRRLELMKSGLGEFLLLESTGIQQERDRLGALIAAIETVARLGKVGIRIERTDSGCTIHFMPAGLLWRWNGERAELICTRTDASAVVDWLMQQLASQTRLSHRSPSGPALGLLATAWALSMQEDFVMMAADAPLGLADPEMAADPERAAEAEMTAEAMLVSFPSGWSPHEKLGQTMRQIHRPVADGEGLRRASPGLSQAIGQKGPFVRHVWNLSRSAALDQHPGSQHPGSQHPRPAGNATSADPTRPLNDIWFRCERQTTLAIPEFARALFLIRVYVAPLREVINSPERRQILIDALRSMSDAVIEYKNLGALRRLVLAEWG